MTASEAIANIKEFPHPANALMAMFIHYGHHQNNIRDKVTEFKIDDKWLVKLNGFPEKKDGIPPYHFYLQYNGWPAGFLGPDGSGTLAAGQGANEGTLIEAIIKRLEAQVDPSPDPTSEEHSAH